MKRLTLREAELLAQKFRLDSGLGITEPLGVKSILRKYRILTLYRPMSERSYGISINVGGAMFIMVNCNSTRGRQHFTIAHELYHLFYDDNPEPHVCNGAASGVEKDANMFASALLMPREGMMREISDVELRNHVLDLATIIRLEQLYGVSRMSLLLRLKDLGVITEQVLLKYSVGARESARAYGYDTSLYKNGNGGIVIGDFGEKAKRLFDDGKISEGHYVELLNVINDGREED